MHVASERRGKNLSCSDEQQKSHNDFAPYYVKQIKNKSNYVFLGFKFQNNLALTMVASMLLQD